jgi:YbbR domain-containing protein
MDDGSHTTPRARANIERWLRQLFYENWNLKLLALGISLVLWYGVNGQRESVTQKFHAVQLTFRLPAGLEISNDPPKSVEITLSGSKAALAGITIRDLVASVDVTRSGEHIEQLTPIRVHLDLPEGVHVDQVDPNRVAILVEPRIEREVEVEARLSGTLPEGYELRSVNISPNKIKVRGPESHVAVLQKARTETISLDGRKAAFPAPQISLDIPDEKIDPVDTVVNVYLDIGEQRIEKTLKGVSVRDESGAPANPRIASVTLYGPRSVIEKLHAGEIQIKLGNGEDGSLVPGLLLPSGIDGVELRSTNPSKFSPVKTK